MNELLTARLVLRRFKDGDAPALAAALSDAETMRFFPYGAAKTAAAAQARAEAQIDAYNRHWRERGYGVWALEDRNDCDFVGRLGLRYVDELAEVELLYLIVRPRWRQGLASEAGKRALRFAFDDAGLTQVIALALPQNAPSRAVMTKLGMAYRGEVRVWGQDLVRYAIERPAEG